MSTPKSSSSFSAQSLRRDRRGVTLVEIMMAVALVSVGILGFFGAFRYISRSLHVSRTRTLATNLAQEKIEILKNLGYYNLLITTASASIPGFPSNKYDTGNYGPETISISGVTYTRYSYVTLAVVNNDVISAVSYTYPDTGLKQITTYVTWVDNGASKIWSLNNLLENPNVNALNSTFSGQITQVGGGALAGAIVKVEQNPSWYTTADASGNYSLSVTSGSYSLRASSVGFYDSVSALQTASPNATTTVNLALSAIATGTISGSAWFNPNVVISQVVTETDTVTGAGTTQPVEYIELFNPTTYQISVTDAGHLTHFLKINYWSPNTPAPPGAPPNDVSDANFNFTYVSTYIPSGKYYLIASTGSFYVMGQLRWADAFYGAPYSANCQLQGGYIIPNCLGRTSGGSVEILDANGNSIDLVGWKNTAGSGNGKKKKNFAGSIGLGNQMVRFSSPTIVSASLGRAYNSGDNSQDFLYPCTVGGCSPPWSGITFSPYSTSNSSQPVLSGVPATSAEVAATDSYSGSTQAYAANVSFTLGGAYSQPYAPFTLVGVATGTWNVDIATTNYFTEIDNIAVAQGAATWIPNATTSPPWPASNAFSVLLTSSTTSGFIKGTVTDINNNPINGIQVLAGAVTKTTGSNGTYFALVSTGIINDVANPNSLNPNYIQQITQPTVTTSQLTIQNFTLSQGGNVTGYLTTGTTPLPNFIVTALVGGSQYGAAASDSSGHFTILNLSTGAYIIQPVISAGQTSSPLSQGVTVNGGSTVWSATFTVTGAFGAIGGTASYNSSPITSGAMIIASTITLTTPPASIYGSSSTAQSPVYAVSCLADGTYNLPVRAASGYNLLISMPTVGPNGAVTIVSKTYSGINVSASATTPLNLTLP